MRTSRPQNKKEKEKPLTNFQQEKVKPKRRKVKLPPNSRLSKELIRQFDNFLEYVPPDRLCKSLRNMFLIYLSHEKDGLPLYFEDTVIDLYILLQLLDKATEELQQQAS